MAKKQNYYYVLVMTNNGAVFVTSIDYKNKMARWDKTEKPLEMGKYRAEDLTLGLNLNFNLAFTVCSKFELDEQPYRYDVGEFMWQSKEDDSKTDLAERTA